MPQLIRVRILGILREKFEKLLFKKKKQKWNSIRFSGTCERPITLTDSVEGFLLRDFHVFRFFFKRDYNFM